MNDNEQKKILADNITHYISINGKQQKEVALAIGENPTTFNMWCNGKSMPSVGKIQKIADYFGIGKSDLTDRRNDSDLEDMFAKITLNISLYDERFRDIIIDYYGMTKEKKNLFCDFYEEFIKNERD